MVGRTHEPMTFDQWAHMRLTSLVREGRDDLRTLRDRFAMSVQGRLIHASAVTDEEREDVEKIIREG